MRTSLLVASALALASTAHAQIPNGGFESWYNNVNYVEPTGWWTTNAVTYSLGTVPSCEQGMPGAVGTSFAKVTTRDLGSFGIEIGHMVSGDPNVGFPGFPYAGRPTALNGQWQYFPQGNDMGGYVHAALTRWNSQTMQRDVIGVCTMTTTSAITSWQSFSAPITYFSALDPDTASIHIEASPGNGVAVGGTSLWVDDLNFTATQGVQEESAFTGVQLYPSIASDRVHIAAAMPISEVILRDVSGRDLLRMAQTGLAMDVDIAHLPAGIYLACVRAVDGRSVALRFAKE